MKKVVRGKMFFTGSGFLVYATHYEYKGIVEEMSEKVSVLMTVYNDADRFLVDSISSILNQSYNNLEFVIVNDGSTDNSEEIIKNFADKDNRIVFINRSINKGRSFSLNEGLESCTSELIFINDADDISLPNRISECKTFYKLNIRNKKSFGLLGTAYVIARNNGKEKVVHYLKFGTLNKKRFQMWRLLIGMPFPHSSVMYSRNALKQIQGFPRNITSSIDFFSLIKIANTCDIYGLNKVLVERNLDNKNFFMTKEMTMRNEINMKNINLWCNKNINFYTILVLPRKIREILLKIKVFR